MKLFDAIKGVKNVVMSKMYNDVEEVSEFDVLVDEIKNKYKKEEICVVKYNYKFFAYIANPKGSIKNCKALIIEDAPSIPANMLKEAKNLEMVVMADEGLLIIPPKTFKDCHKLKFVYFPNSLMTIGACAFENCTALKDVICNYKSEFFRVESMAFKGCTSLEKISFGSLKCNIYRNAFDGCENLKSIIITGDSIIHDYVFKGLKNLRYIRIRNLMNYLGPLHNRYFDDYVWEAYKEEYKKNCSVAINAPLEIKANEKALNAKGVNEVGSKAETMEAEKIEKIEEAEPIEELKAVEGTKQEPNYAFEYERERMKEKEKELEK